MSLDNTILGTILKYGAIHYVPLSDNDEFFLFKLAGTTLKCKQKKGNSSIREFYFQGQPMEVEVYKQDCTILHKKKLMRRWEDNTVEDYLSRYKKQIENSNGFDIDAILEEQDYSQGKRKRPKILNVENLHHSRLYQPKKLTKEQKIIFDIVADNTTGNKQVHELLKRVGLLKERGKRDKTLDEFKKLCKSLDCSQENKPVLTITYSVRREVLLNNSIVLAKPNFDGRNDQVFSYLIKNPGKKITLKELNENIEWPIEGRKSLHKIVEKLGFRKELLELFFKVSKTTITFHNPIYKNELVQILPSLLKKNAK